MIRGLDGLAVLIEPHKGAIEVVPGKVEIVRIAAEEGGHAFRREHQPDIGIFAIGVKLVLAALIEGHNLALVLVFLAGAAFLLDCGDLRIARLDEILTGLACGGPGHAIGDVGDIRQNVGLHAGAEFFVFAFGDLKTVLHIIGRGGGQMLGAIDHAMMVGQDQAIAGHDRSGAARRKPY